MDRPTRIKLGLAFVAAAAVFVGLFALLGWVVEGVLAPKAPKAPPSAPSAFPPGPADPAGVERTPREPGPADRPAGGPSSKASARVSALIEDLGAASYATRRDAEAALVRLGARAVPGLEQALTHADPEVRWRAREALRRIRAGE